MTGYIKRADAIGIIEDYIGKDYMTPMSRLYSLRSELSALPSADAEPKWNCTANFVAEQLDRLRKMTDEEKWNFFREFFGMGDAVQGEWHKTENEEMEITGYYCSVCDMPTDEPTNYCGNCGARMKGGAE